MQYKNFITSPKEASSSEKRKISYYKQGVRVRFPKKSPPLRLQILPAYNQMDPANLQGSVPCLVSGQPTAWFGMIQSAKFVGHGDWKSTVPILSLASFEGKEPCPYLKLHNYCKKAEDWKYLTSSVGRFGAPDYQDCVLKPVKSVLLLNIVDVDNPGLGVQLCEMSYSVANALLNVETGLVFQRNLQLDNYPDAAGALAADPMLAYANGDITNPRRAPVFVMELSTAKAGKFGAGYTLRIDVTNGQVTRRAASDCELASRYHLDDPESFLEIPTGQDIVDNLVSVLKGHKNARGIDETCAIKEAVGDTYRVDTVQAPGAVNTVQGWRLPPEEPVEQTSVPVQPNPVVTPVQTQTVSNPIPAQSVPDGFAPNPAQATASGARIPIPGEMATGSEAALAASLAAQMRSQMNMRR